MGKTLVHSTGLLDCLDVAAGHKLWKGREAWRSSAGLFNRRGVGISAVMQACGYGPVVPDVANAKIELTSDGTLRVYCGVVDMGQGSASTNLQIVGSILGQNAARIELIQPDTDRTLPSGSASASRCMYTFGNALIEGFRAEERFHIIQEAFIECGAVQCGFCTPGMVAASADLLTRNPSPAEVQCCVP